MMIWNRYSCELNNRWCNVVSISNRWCNVVRGREEATHTHRTSLMDCDSLVRHSCDISPVEA
jgi:hypothetical protein